jgi:Tol biopolymer transport system component
VRPDGGAVAYVRHSGDIMSDRFRPSIWLVDAATGEQRPLVADDRSNLAPRWSPDGRRLAYVSAGPGGPPQLFVLWLDSGKAAKVATLEQAPSALAWSPDGKSLALSMLVTAEGEKLGAPMAKPEGAAWAEPLKIIGRVTYRADGEGYLKPGYNQLFVVAADGGAPRQLTSGAFNAEGPLAWTPDGRSVLYASNHGPDWERDAQESEVFSVDVASGAETQLTHRKGPDRGAQVSPDGKLIAYHGYDDHVRGYENERLYVMDRDGGHPRVLTGDLDRSVQQAQWSADGRSLVFSYGDHGRVRLARVGLDGKIEQVADGVAGGGLDRPYSGGQFSRAGGTIAYTQGAPHPPAMENWPPE